MRRLLLSALSALLFAQLAACESAASAEALYLAPDVPRRCARCGWIEAKEVVPPGAADPQGRTVYEYTVRMADGSSGVFRERLPAKWRLGERLIFIDGARAVH